VDAILSIGTILGALMVGVVSPGPSFVFVAQTSVADSRRNGVAAALGMGAGAALFAALVLFGLHAVLASSPWLYFVLKLAGGLYLLYLAIRIWKGAAEPLALTDTATAFPPRSWLKSFMMGFGTMVSNPKAVVQYGSIFAALLPHDIPLALALTLVPLVYLLESGWYCVVALVLSSTSPRKVYLKLKAPIDRIAAGVMGLLGLKLVYSAQESV
jgi:threonine/homoserine/homoserine lactone efflux protein